MKIETKIDYWLEIQELVRKDFLTALSEEEIIVLVKSLNIDIRGFSKRIENAPSILLRNSLTNNFRKLKLKDFLKSYVPDSYRELKNQGYEEGIKRIASDSRLSKSEVISLVGVLYPEKYEDLRSKFIKYLGEEGNPLAHIIELETKDILETLVSNYEKIPMKMLDKIELDFKNINLDSVKENFISDYKLEKNIAFNLFMADKNDEITLARKDRTKILELAIYELINEQLEAYKQIEQLKEENEKQKEVNNNLQKENERTIVKLEKSFEKERKKYEAKLNEKQETIKGISEEHKTLLNKKNLNAINMQKTIDDLTRQLNHAKDSKVAIIDETDKVIIFTERKEEYEDYVDRTILKTLEEIKNIEAQFKNYKYFFVDGFGMSTSKKRNIRKISNEHDLKIKLLSDYPNIILRKIIFHIEGEGLY